MSGKIKVLNITGWGRSGSTILGSVLGEVNGFFFGGEIRNLWNKVLIENRLCGCQSPVLNCKLWEKIFCEAFGGVENIKPVEMRNLMLASTRTRHIPLIFLPGARNVYRKKLKLFLNKMEKLFSGIQSTTNCNVIIDSSKTPVYGFVLSLIDSVDLYVIHLIRDPRGIAYSRQKSKLHQDNANKIQMKKFNPGSSSFMWDIRNLTSEMMWKNNPKYLIVRYEDFVSRPKEVIEKILRLVNEPVNDLPFFQSPDKVKLSVNHAVWGNPGRFKTGIVELKDDNEWQEKLSPQDKTITKLLTLPLLKKYGYRLED